MKVSGFSFVRNAVKFDYPIREAILSILPLCDEFVVAVGNSEDNTRELISSVPSGKIKIIDTVWDETLRDGGKVLALETDKALGMISPDSDWAFYIQGDEAVHEDYLQVIREGMEKWRDDPRVEGLLFDYLHFFGSYDYLGISRSWYRREVRIIRNDRNIRSYRDAQGFRKNDRKLAVKQLQACIFHYGWVKPPETQMAKQRTFNRFWHDDGWVNSRLRGKEEFDYSGLTSVKKFGGSHPLVMQERIKRQNWVFKPEASASLKSVSEKAIGALESRLGIRLGEYKNYRLI